MVSFGGLEASDRELGALPATGGRQEASKRQARGSQKAKGGAQVEISGVKRGTEGHQGAPRGDKGLGRRRWGGQPGEGGTLR